ncbi:MAG: glycosyltransferase [Bacteroidetes bacterium]|nr:glycosyltransferase [Bacteroidota bacterium]
MSSFHYTYIFPLLLGIVALMQLWYYFNFFLRLANYKNKEKVASQEYPVTIIICAKNEAGNLVKNLPGVLLQEYRTTHEIIVVNDNSTDESKYILEEFQKKFKDLSIIALKQEAKGIPGKKFPLSVGIKSAKHETLLLTDADCIPASEFWLQKMQDAYQPGIEIVLGYGAYKKYPGMLNKLIRFETFHTAMQYFSYALAGKPYMGVGRNLSYRKDIFLRNKGFSSINHIPSGDDDLFINKIATKTNTAIVIDKDAHTLSEPHQSWSSWMQQKNRHYTTAKYYKPSHKLLLGLYSTLQTLIYPLTIITAIFFNWYIAVGIFALRLLVQTIIWYKCMKKLNEGDLFSMFLFFDIWMFLYNLFFFPSLFKKPSRKWD